MKADGSPSTRSSGPEGARAAPIVCVGLIAGLLAVSAAQTLPSGQVVATGESPHFRLTMPTGFHPHADGDAGPGVSHTYLLDQTISGMFAVLVHLRALSGPLPRGRRIDPGAIRRELSAGASLLRIDSRTWKSHELDALWVRIEEQGMTFLTASVHVPLKGRALELRISGSETQEKLLARYLDEMLANLDGEPGWLTPPRPPGRIIRTVAALLAAALLVVVGLWAAGRARRSGRQGGKGPPAKGP